VSAQTATAGTPGRSRSADDLRALASEGAALGEVSADEALAWLAERVGPRVAVACSMADGVLPHLVSQHLPGVDVLFLDTGYHFLETRIARDEVADRLDVTVVDVLPELTIAEQAAAHGPDLFARDPALCCEIRKMAPLARALRSHDAWVTGVRREEAPTRTTTPLVSFDERHGLIKVNPLAAWSFDDLLAYAAQHAVPLNLLLSQGYPSIGCEPCTRPVAPGADPRSGRWAGLAKTECGIHT
jgi:phosphoadenosine phosphosulfate reductase